MRARLYATDEGYFLNAEDNNRRIYLIEIDDKANTDIHPDFLKVVKETGGVVNGTDGYFRNKKKAARAIGQLSKLIK